MFGVLIVRQLEDAQGALPRLAEGGVEITAPAAARLHVIDQLANLPAVTVSCSSNNLFIRAHPPNTPPTPLAH